MSALLRRVSRRPSKKSQLLQLPGSVLASIRRAPTGVWAAAAGAAGSIALIGLITRRLLRRGDQSTSSGENSQAAPQSASESSQEAAAAQEAAQIGGTSRSHAGVVEPDRPATASEHPVAEAGGGESEGQEQFEADLADATSPPND